MTTPLHKRIMNEIPGLENICEFIQLTFESNKDPTLTLINTLIHINLYDIRIKTPLQFILPKDYPFKPPTLLLDHIPYLKTLPHIQLDEYRVQIRKPLPTKFRCLHCDFITKDTWSPALGIKTVVHEFILIEKTRQIIREHILLTHLGKKNRIPKEITDLIHEYIS